MRAALFIVMLALAALPGTAPTVLADESKPFPGDPNDPGLLPEWIPESGSQGGGSDTGAGSASGSGTVTNAGPSFNCNYAKLPAEVAICNSPELSELDRRMAQIFFSKRNSMTGNMQLNLQQFQSQWLRQRNACGYDLACLRQSHLQHIQSLTGWPY